MARMLLYGNTVSPGIAIGPLHLMHSMRLFEKRRIEEAEIRNEQKILENAAKKLRSVLSDAINDIPESLSEYRSIMLSQMELAGDPKILDSAKARIGAQKICATWALNETMEELCGLFSGMPDAYLRERAQDIKAVCLRLADVLAGVKTEQDAGHGNILAAYEVSPADIMDMGPDGIAGLLTVEGSPASHTAILARSLQIPAITGLPELLTQAREGEKIIVDGLKGVVLLNPDENELREYQKLRDEYLIFEKEAQEAALREATTLDGTILEICANLENPGELALLEASGAKGVGLYRTEYAYLGGPLPDEDALHREYTTVLEKVWPNQVVFRTLDIGSDKFLIPEDLSREKNPALGLRGIRFCLEYEGIFRTQLRAILRAAANGNAAILLPMISRSDEIDKTRQLMALTAAELAREGLPHKKKLPLGVMIETPAAALITDILAGECDFISVGTNDLIHYILAIDRNNRRVAHLHDPLHPAVIRTLKTIVDAAHARNVKVAVCGELAADPAGIALLLGLGVDGLSAAPRLVPGVKHILRKLDGRACAKFVDELVGNINGCGKPHFRTTLFGNFASGTVNSYPTCVIK